MQYKHDTVHFYLQNIQLLSATNKYSCQFEAIQQCKKRIAADQTNQDFPAGVP